MTTLDGLRRLHEQSTPPPWVRYDCDGADEIQIDYYVDDDLYYDPAGPEDKDLVIAARNALPALLALADAARAWRKLMDAYEVHRAAHEWADSHALLEPIDEAEAALLAAVEALEA